MNSLPKREELLEFVLTNKDELRKEPLSKFLFVGDNYIHFKDHINSQCTSMICEFIANELGYTYESVAEILDYETLKGLVGEEWFRF